MAEATLHPFFGDLLVNIPCFSPVNAVFRGDLTRLRSGYSGVRYFSDPTTCPVQGVHKSGAAPPKKCIPSRVGITRVLAVVRVDTVRN